MQFRYPDLAALEDWGKGKCDGVTTVNVYEYPTFVLEWVWAVGRTEAMNPTETEGPTSTAASAYPAVSMVSVSPSGAFSAVTALAAEISRGC